jgi:GNAT superfamily N-acetyltransferase
MPRNITPASIKADKRYEASTRVEKFIKITISRDTHARIRKLATQELLTINQILNKLLQATDTGAIMNTHTSIRETTKIHMIQGKPVIHEIWSDLDGQIYSYYGFGDSIAKSNYNIPATICATVNENQVKIEDFVVRDINQGIGSAILSDFLAYCKQKGYWKVHISISPEDDMNSLIKFYKKAGFTSFAEDDGFVIAAAIFE